MIESKLIALVPLFEVCSVYLQLAVDRIIHVMVCDSMSALELIRLQTSA